MSEPPADAVVEALQRLTDTIGRQVDALEHPPPPKPDPVLERLDRIIALLERPPAMQVRYLDPWQVRRLDEPRPEPSGPWIGAPQAAPADDWTTLRAEFADIVAFCKEHGYPGEWRDTPYPDRS